MTKSEGNGHPLKVGTIDDFGPIVLFPMRYAELSSTSGVPLRSSTSTNESKY